MTARAHMRVIVSALQDHDTVLTPVQVSRGYFGQGTCALCHLWDAIVITLWHFSLDFWKPEIDSKVCYGSAAPYRFADAIIYIREQYESCTIRLWPCTILIACASASLSEPPPPQRPWVFPQFSNSLFWSSLSRKLISVGIAFSPCKRSFTPTYKAFH